MKAEEFYTIFQEKYSIIKAFEMERYKLEEKLFLAAAKIFIYLLIVY